MNEDTLFRLHGIELLSFSLTEPPVSDKSIKSFQFNFEQNQKAEREKKLIVNIVTIKINDTKSKAQLAYVKIACGFEIAAFHEVVKEGSHGEAIIDHALNINLSKIAAATARGVLFSQLKGSYLHRAMLPILPFELD